MSDLRAVSPPAWSGDGRRIAFATADAVWTVRGQAGAEPHRLTAMTGVDRVAWSPDGGAVTVLAGGRLLTVDLDDPSPRPLVPSRGVQCFAWPPVGARGGFGRAGRLSGPVYASAAGGRTAVWALRDAERPFRIGSLPSGIAARSLIWLAGDAGVAVTAAGGGDADRIVFLRPDARAASRVERLPAGGRDPVPSPAGRFIAYLEDAGGGESRVAAVRAGGAGRRVLTPPGHYTGLAWSPSDTLVAFARQDGEWADLEIADVLTGQRLHVGDYRPEMAASDAPLVIVWAPGGTRLAFGTDTGETAGFVWLATLERR